MNIALEKTEEFVNGKLRRNYGDAFVRGNNGTPVSLLCRPPCEQQRQYTDRSYSTLYLL